MTDNEIIKALECCSVSLSDVTACKNCPLQEAEEITCITILSKNTLDLINRLKTRIVRYQLKNTNQRNSLASLNKKVAEQKTEIERLRDENIKLHTLIPKMIITAKTEAIKEFAERLKKAIPHFDGDTTMECVDGAISIVIDEMTEGK